jgi:crotonobetainyl-CoA:carnitine CoA-transferase CaiB-like acyl-CoA transferase
MRPLEDVRIVAVEQYGAGPWGSLHLADLGADVIKVEDPRTGGDVSRYVPPRQQGEDSLFHEAFNRNKRSIQLDLSTPAGTEVLHDLLRDADALSTNLRGDVVARLGLTYADLREVNPRLVCCSLSAYGVDSPSAAVPGYDYIMQGRTGWMSVTGEPDGPPTKSGLSLVDFSGGFVAAIALLAGIHAARRDGVGMDCDLSLYDTALSLLNYPAAWYLNGGPVPVRTRHSAHPSLVPFQNLRASDGWLVVGCAKERFWRRLAVALGEEGWVEDPRFATFAARRQHADVLLPLLEARFAAHPVAHWLELLADAGVPCGPVNDVPQALADPLVEARGMLLETEHPVFGTVRQLASPVKVGPAATSHRRAPRRHEHGPELLAGLGYDPARVAELTAAGAFGELPPAPLDDPEIEPDEATT